MNYQVVMREFFALSILISFFGSTFNCNLELNLMGYKQYEMNTTCEKGVNFEDQVIFQGSLTNLEDCDVSHVQIQRKREADPRFSLLDIFYNEKVCKNSKYVECRHISENAIEFLLKIIATEEYRGAKIRLLIQSKKFGEKMSEEQTFPDIEDLSEKNLFVTFNEKQISQSKELCNKFNNDSNLHLFVTCSNSNVLPCVFEVHAKDERIINYNFVSKNFKDFNNEDFNITITASSCNRGRKINLNYCFLKKDSKEREASLDITEIYDIIIGTVGAVLGVVIVILCVLGFALFWKRTRTINCATCRNETVENRQDFIQPVTLDSIPEEPQQQGSHESELKFPETSV